MYIRFSYVLTVPVVLVLPCPCVHGCIMDKHNIDIYQLNQVLYVRLVMQCL